MTLRAFATTGHTRAEGDTLVFLANSGKQMRCNGETVDLATLRIPVVGGDLKLVNELTESDDISVPLLIDHIPGVQYQAGAVRSLRLTDEGLEATAELAHNDNADLVRSLLDADMLKNSFSVTIDFDRRDYDDNNVIHNAELCEISVVWQGADQHTRVIDRFSKGTSMQINTTGVEQAVASFALSDEDKQRLTDAVTAAMQTALDTIVNDINDGDTEPEEDNPDGNPAEDPQPPQQSTNSKETPMNPIVIQKPLARQPLAHTKQRPDWLESNDALAAFERNLLDNDGRGPANTRRAWVDYARQHSDYASSIDEDSVDQLIPKPVIEEITDVYNTADELWPLLNKTGMDQYTVGKNSNGLKASDGTGRAHGYPVSSYGTQKTDEKITLVSRTLLADYIYKRGTLNKGDIRRTQRPGALVRYLVRELGNRIFQTIGYSVVFNDWTDMSMFRSIETDAADSSSTWKGNEFALTLEEGTYANLLFDFKMAAARVKAAGEKVLVCNSTTAAELGITTNQNGTPMLPLSNADVARVIGVSRIITPVWWDDANDATMKGVVFVPSKYGVVGDTSVEAFTNFSLDTNENVYLQEIYAGGGLMEEKSACIVTPSES